MHTDLASNAQFFLGEIAYKQKQYDQAVSEYDKVLSTYPRASRSFPRTSAKAWPSLSWARRLRRRELRDVIKRYPNTEEDASLAPS